VGKDVEGDTEGSFVGLRLGRLEGCPVVGEEVMGGRQNWGVVSVNKIVGSMEFDVYTKLVMGNAIGPVNNMGAHFGLVGLVR